MLFKITENYPEKCFSTKEKEAWLKFKPGSSANCPSNNWALEKLKDLL